MLIPDDTKTDQSVCTWDTPSFILPEAKGIIPENLTA